MRFILFRRQFHISLVLLVLVIFATVVLLRLGVWQLQRAADKAAFLESLSRANNAPIEQVAQLPDNVIERPDWQYKKVQLQGQYLNDRQLLVDNQFNGDSNDQRAGYDVLTPFLLQDNSIILVNRGWVSRNLLKNEKPNVEFASNTQSVSGIIRAPSKAFALGEMLDENDTWPKLIQFIDTALLQQQFEQTLQPVILLLLPDQPNGYTRIWQTRDNIKMGPMVHYGYAFQWFALAATLIGLCLFMMIKNSEKQLNE